MLLRRALELLERREFGTAAETCRVLLGEQPTNCAARTVLGLALGAEGQAEAAAAALDQVARARPAEPHPCHALTGLLMSLDRGAEILPQYEACLRLAGDDASLRLALAQHAQDAGLDQRALHVLAPVRAADPECLEAVILCGIAHANLGRFELAEAAFREAVRIDPNQAAGWSNLGMMLKVAGRFDEGLEAADRAVALAPDNLQYRLSRGILKLRAGWLADAWDDYDARLLLPGRAPLPPERALRDAAQLASLAGRTVLVIHEDGFGDTLNFIRYAPMLAERGLRVLARVPRELAGLLARMPGLTAVSSGGEPLPEYDLHCHVSDLPRVFASTLETIPATVPYLRCDPDRVASWAARLPPRAGRLRVGLAWAGQARPYMPGFHVVDGRRSMALAELGHLAGVENVQFVSLQKGPPARQTPPPGLLLHDPMAEVADFDDTAAIVANLDVVVSVDTAVAHLAGALARPVLLLDRYDSCWRWFHGREDSPWYPTLRILRQQTPLDWAPVIARAACMLTERAAPSRPPARH